MKRSLRRSVGLLFFFENIRTPQFRKKTMDDELNISWMNELETDPINTKEHTSTFTPTDKVNIECQPTTEIQYIFINSVNEIEHFFKETYDCFLRDTSKSQLFEKPKTQLSKEEILKLIQSNKIQRNKRYRLSEMLEYYINLEEEEWNELLETNAVDFNPQNLTNYFNKKTFLKKINFVDDIFFEPSVSLFHKINCLYLIYIENDSIVPVTKPPIKISMEKVGNNIKQKTKKVRFNEENLVKINKKMTTTKKTY